MSVGDLTPGRIADLKRQLMPFRNEFSHDLRKALDELTAARADVKRVDWIISEAGYSRIEGVLCRSSTERARAAIDAAMGEDNE